MAKTMAHLTLINVNANASCKDTPWARCCHPMDPRFAAEHGKSLRRPVDRLNIVAEGSTQLWPYESFWHISDVLVLAGIRPLLRAKRTWGGPSPHGSF